MVLVQTLHDILYCSQTSFLLLVLSSVALFHFIHFLCAIRVTGFCLFRLITFLSFVLYNCVLCTVFWIKHMSRKWQREYNKLIHTIIYTLRLSISIQFISLTGTDNFYCRQIKHVFVDVCEP